MKSVRLTLREIHGIKNGLINLLKEDFISTTTFKLLDIIDAIDAKMATYNKAVRVLHDKYGESDGKGGSKIKKSMLKKFEAEHAELLNKVVDINIIKLETSDFARTTSGGKRVEVNLKPGILITIRKLIVGKEPKDEKDISVVKKKKSTKKKGKKK